MGVLMEWINLIWVFFLIPSLAPMVRQRVLDP